MSASDDSENNQYHNSTSICAVRVQVLGEAKKDGTVTFQQSFLMFYIPTKNYIIIHIIYYVYICFFLVELAYIESSRKSTVKKTSSITA